MNIFRCLPTWDLICELMGQRDIPHIKTVLNERMAAFTVPNHHS
jgi:hypothetical protein